MLRNLLVSASLLVFASSVFAEDAKLFREIDTKDFAEKVKAEGKVTAPTKITSAEELEKAVGKDVAEKAGKGVDFKKEYLVLFAWSGSGGDLLKAATGEGDKPNVVFTHIFGKTRDLRPHVKLFAITKDTEFKVGK